MLKRILDKAINYLFIYYKIVHSVQDGQNRQNNIKIKKSGIKTK